MGLSHSPSIVTSNLVLCFDPANPKSYSGSGNTIYNAASSSNNGAIENGALYTSQLSGYFNFDGSNDRISVTDASSINFTDNFSKLTPCKFLCLNIIVEIEDGFLRMQITLWLLMEEIKLQMDIEVQLLQ